MQLLKMRVQNYRRLRDCQMIFSEDTTILVGANNSGKTSAAHVLQAFLGNDRPRVSIYDLNLACWPAVNAYGDSVDPTDLPFPTISLDVWLSVDQANLQGHSTFCPVWTGLTLH